MIAICNPELCGDVLWSVPAARALSLRHGQLADFWVSSRGKPLTDLLLVQPFIRTVIVDWRYIPQPGGGPGFVAMTDDELLCYDKVYQLGFQRTIHGTLLDHFCETAGLPRQGHWFNLPKGCPAEPLPEGPFVCLAAKGYGHPEWIEMFREFARRCTWPVVEVGPPGQAIATDIPGATHRALDRCRSGFLEMAGVISKCRWFVGTISAPLVIADAMPDVTRIAVYDERWTLERCTRSPLNHYVGPDWRQILELIRE